MDSFSGKILEKLLPAAPDAGAIEATSRTRQKKAVLQSDHWSNAVLLERAAYLRKLAKNGNGAESETLKEFPRHCAMLLFRSRDGGAEVHENFADLFCVLDGRATLVTGGTVAGAVCIGPGEIRGTSVEGGARQELSAGDVAHVPAGLPHQMLVAGDHTVTCMVMKIQET
ncbi:MAG: hypothetical protein ABR905_09555 [Terracidiphilus sp.]|jgi:mannose-6-phosphate isomerase-like protein (cupin superfamily)